jgi:hypothetical protein
MKADHIMIILGIFIIVMVATQTIWQKSDPVGMVDRNCALFYRDLGHEAEQHCKTEMMEQHSLRSDGKSLSRDLL